MSALVPRGSAGVARAPAEVVFESAPRAGLESGDIVALLAGHDDEIGAARRTRSPRRTPRRATARSTASSSTPNPAGTRTSSGCRSSGRTRTSRCVAGTTSGASEHPWRRIGCCRPPGGARSDCGSRRSTWARGRSGSWTPGRNPRRAVDDPPDHPAAQALGQVRAAGDGGEDRVVEGDFFAGGAAPNGDAPPNPSTRGGPSTGDDDDEFFSPGGAPGASDDSSLALAGRESRLGRRRLPRARDAISQRHVPDGDSRDGASGGARGSGVRAATRSRSTRPCFTPCPA